VLLIRTRRRVLVRVRQLRQSTSCQRWIAVHASRRYLGPVAPDPRRRQFRERVEVIDDRRVSFPYRATAPAADVSTRSHGDRPPTVPVPRGTAVGDRGAHPQRQRRRHQDCRGHDRGCGPPTGTPTPRRPASPNRLSTSVYRRCLGTLVLRERFGLPGPVPTVADAAAAMPRAWLNDRQRSAMAVALFGGHNLNGAAGILGLTPSERHSPARRGAVPNGCLDHAIRRSFGKLRTGAR
jgi:hypothetical protein